MEVSINSFEGLVENYLKAEDVTEFPAEVFVTAVKVESREGNNKVLYDVQYKDKKYKWSCNISNLRELIKKGYNAPKDIVNKRIVFTTTKVRNPQTKQLMDSLVISDIK